MWIDGKTRKLNRLAEEIEEHIKYGNDDIHDEAWELFHIESNYIQDQDALIDHYEMILKILEGSDTSG